jgi:MFS family permease
MEASNTATMRQGYSSEAKRTIFAAFVSWFVDSFDLYIPTVALAPAMIYFMPKGLPDYIAATIFYLTLVATLIGRPTGAAVFGHFGDRMGRRKTSLISVAGVTVATLLVAFLPGYEISALWGIGLLLFLRFLGGFFIGGEYTAALPLAMEYTPKEKRGPVSALILSGYPVSFILISLITALLLYVMPYQGIHSAYVQWGWRIPFLVGVIISTALYFYFSKYVPESKLWSEGKKAKTPLKDLFSGESLKGFVQVFLLMSGVWFSYNAIVGTLTGVLTTILKINSRMVTNTVLISYVFVLCMFFLVGILIQKFGRRPVLMAGGVLNFTVAPLLYAALIAGGFKSTPFLIVSCIILFVLAPGSVWGIAAAYINERFKTSVRASGFGLGYSLAAIIPAFYSFYMLWLKALMPYIYTPIVLAVLGGILIFVGAVLGPETKDVDF